MAFDADRTCALAAVDALAGQIPTTTPILLRIVRSHPDLSIRLAAAAALRDTATEDVLPVFIEGLLAPYPALQTQAFTLLATIDPHHPALRQVLADPNTPEVLKSLAVQHLSTHTPSDPLIRQWPSILNTQSSCAVLLSEHSRSKPMKQRSRI